MQLRRASTRSAREKVADEPCRNAVPARQNAEALWGFRQTAFLSFPLPGASRPRPRSHQNTPESRLALALHISGRKSSPPAKSLQAVLPPSSESGRRAPVPPSGEKNRPELDPAAVRKNP